MDTVQIPKKARGLKSIFVNLRRYSFLLKELVSRDFKVKYKRSVLGVLWSLLYPVLMMAVMAVIFSNFFKFHTENVDYLVYLQVGLIIFNYFSEASNLAMSSVVANFSLINKVYIPKYIFPLSKCLFVGINFLITLIPLTAVVVFTGTPITWNYLWLPFVFACLFFFTVGMGFLLSTIAIFFRDMFYIYGIVISLWMYLSPIMYDLESVTSNRPLIGQILKVNPMYQFITFSRLCIQGPTHEISFYNLFGELVVCPAGVSMCPPPTTFLYCFLWALFAFLFGVFVFRKNQDKFIYYV